MLDIGCGRGEFLALLKAAGVTARGVDTNREMVATACERGLDAVHADALVFLDSLPDGSARRADGRAGRGTPDAAVPVPAARRRLSEAARRRADRRRDDQPGVLAGVFQQLHPRRHARAARAPGDAAVPAAGERLRQRDASVQPAGARAHEDAARGRTGHCGGRRRPGGGLAQMARTVNANAAILNNLLFTHFDYAAIGYRS